MAIASYLVDILGAVEVKDGKSYNKDNITADANILFVSKAPMIKDRGRGLRCTITSTSTAATTPLLNVPAFFEFGKEIAFSATSTYTFIDNGEVTYGKRIIVT